MNYNELKTLIEQGKLDERFRQLVCKQDVKDEAKRYLDLLSEAKSKFDDGDYHFISSPGRSEIGGNHTDHQGGNVVAAALSIDNVCVCKANNSNKITFIDPHFNPCTLSLDNLDVVEDEKNTSQSLIRGIAARIKQLGYNIGGFDAICDSKVLIGASISSSACFEIMVVEIFNCLYNNNSINFIQRAQIGQYAENVYFGKPCGLLDQMAISAGGFATINFNDASNPIVNNFEFSLDDYDFFIINTLGSHADLSDCYSAIPSEMKLIANKLGVEKLSQTSLENLISNYKQIRQDIKNDRALLRAIHYFNEDKRAILQKKAIEDKDTNKLFELMKQSGRSSYMYLQNVYVDFNPKVQNISLALALTDNFLQDKGTYRVQGGGFEGTIIAFVPKDMSQDYKKLIASTIDEKAILSVSIRKDGTCTVI